MRAARQSAASRGARGRAQGGTIMNDVSLTSANTAHSYLDQLEAEGIHIMRETVAECDKPVMLYSIGKDSSVLLHLAMKAFHPGKPPFPLLHVDTLWKFREMIEFATPARASSASISWCMSIRTD
jgi:sulfate adenylyltransferase subunit 2